MKSTIINNDNAYFTVGISRDPELIAYCNPDIIVTTNKTKSLLRIPQIILTEVMQTEVLSGLYETDLMMEINNRNTQLSKAVFSIIARNANGRQVHIVPYYNAHTTEFRKEGFIVTGPSDELAYHYSRKVVGYKLAVQCEVPVLPGTIVGDLKELRSYLRDNIGKSTFFVASDDNPFFPVNCRISSLYQIHGLSTNCPYLVTRWINAVSSPNSQVIIAKNNIYYLGLTDQIIKHDVRYYGNRYPSRVTATCADDIERYSMVLARAMQQSGYRGFAGFDWVVNNQNDVYFAEINPRKNRSSGVLAAFLDAHRDVGAPTVADLEMYSCSNGYEPPTKWSLPKDLHWAMALYKSDRPLLVTKDIVPKFSERDSFKSPEKSYAVLNFPLKGQKATACPDLARVVVVGETESSINLLLQVADNQITEAVNAA